MAGSATLARVAALRAAGGRQGAGAGSGRARGVRGGAAGGVRPRLQRVARVGLPPRHGHSLRCWLGAALARPWREERGGREERERERRQGGARERGGREEREREAGG